MLSEFGAIALLRYDTFTRAIYNAYRGSFDRTSAAALALILLAITLIVIWFERRYRGGYLANTKALGKRVRVDLGSWSWVAMAGLTLAALVSVGVPILSLLVWSLQGSASLDLAMLLDALWGSMPR